MRADLETIATGDASHVVQMRRTMVRTDDEWRALWAAHAGPGAAAPPVDFSTHMVAAVFQGQRPTSGWDAAIVGTRRAGDALTVLVEESRPRPGAVAAQVVVSPFHIVALPRFDGEVRFEPAERSSEAAAGAEAGGSEAGPHAASSTGLAPETAGALAYLAGPLSGALLLIVERTSRFVRFHAWQALLGLGALAVAAIGCLGFAFLMLIVSPKAFWALLWLAALSAAAWVVVWGVCLVQAYRGRRWKLPLAGTYAERWTRG